MTNCYSVSNILVFLTTAEILLCDIISIRSVMSPSWHSKFQLQALVVYVLISSVCTNSSVLVRYSIKILQGVPEHGSCNRVLWWCLLSHFHQQYNHGGCVFL